MHKYEVDMVIESLEEFVVAIIKNQNSPDVEDAVHLDKKREQLKSELIQILGLQEEEF